MVYYCIDCIGQVDNGEASPVALTEAIICRRGKEREIRTKLGGFLFGISSNF